MVTDFILDFSRSHKKIRITRLMHHTSTSARRVFRPLAAENVCDSGIRPHTTLRMCYGQTKSLYRGINPT